MGQAMTDNISLRHIANIVMGFYEDEEDFNTKTYESSVIAEIEDFRQFATEYEFDAKRMTQAIEHYISNDVNEKILQKILSLYDDSNLSNTNYYMEVLENSEFKEALHDFKIVLESEFKEELHGITKNVDVFGFALPADAFSDLKKNYCTIDGEQIESNQCFSAETAKAILVNHYDEIHNLNTKVTLFVIRQEFIKLVEDFNKGLNNKEIFDLYDAEDEEFYFDEELEEKMAVVKCAPKPM
jgi:hypothetical protein